VVKTKDGDSLIAGRTTLAGHSFEPNAGKGGYHGLQVEG